MCKGGRYKYNEKTYDVILEIEGESIKEDRKNLNCINCENNVYTKNLNKYEIEKGNFDNFINKLKEIINNVIKDKN